MDKKIKHKPQYDLFVLKNISPPADFMNGHFMRLSRTTIQRGKWKYRMLHAKDRIRFERKLGANFEQIKQLIENHDTARVSKIIVISTDHADKVQIPDTIPDEF